MSSPLPHTRFLCLLLALLGLGVSAAEAELKMAAQLQRSSIAVGDTTIVVIQMAGTNSPPKPTIEVEEGDAAGVKASFLGNSSQTTIENGRIQQFYSFQFRVTGLKQGTYKLAGTIESGGETLATDPMTLTVRPQTEAEKRMAPELELAVGKTEIYLGEMLPLRVIFSTSPSTDPEFHNGSPEVESNGFVMQPLNGIMRARPDENGRERHYFEGACEALRAGDLTLGPATYPLTVLIRNRATRLATRRQYNLQSNSLTIKVKPLPTEGKPESFDGAVGRFDMAAKASPLKVSQGEPISVTLTVSGTGNLPSINVPSLTGEASAWKLYPPSRVDSRDNNRQRRDPMAPVSNSGRVTFTQVVVPLETESEIPPFEFSFFDPDTQSYRTLRSDPIEIEVTPDPNAGKGTVVTQPTPPTPADDTPPPPRRTPPPVEEMTDILSIRDVDDQAWAAAQPPLARSALFWAMQAPPAAALVTLFFIAINRRLGGRQKDTGWAGTYPPCAELLRQLESKPEDAQTFYKLAHQFIAAWEEQSPGAATAPLEPSLAAAIDQIRDRHNLLAFGSTTEEAAAQVDQQEQREVLKNLRSLPGHA